MTEAEWLTCDDPERMVCDGLAPRLGVMYRREGGLPRSRKADLFAVACCREIWHLLLDPDSKRAVEWLEVNAGRRPRHGDEGYDEYDEHGSAIKHATESGEGSHAQILAAYVAEELWCGGVGIPLFHFRETFPKEYPNDLPGETSKRLAGLLRDIFGNPFRPVSGDPGWLTSTVLALARGIDEELAFDRLPILADALQDAGCEDTDILDHCRGPGPHVRGCWVLDLVLGKG